MKKSYVPPLIVSFIWNPSDNEVVDPLLKVFRNTFARDKDKPFSRSLNIPLFFYSSLNCNEVPENSPTRIAGKNIVFVFTSVNTLGRPVWKNYVEALPRSNSINIVPVAVDRNGLRHAGILEGLNCIRMYEWPKVDLDLYATVSLAHELYRYGFSRIKPDEEGKKSSISLFLSHAKAGDTGRVHSERIKTFIDNSNMNRFFDANEISPGYKFDEEIERSIKNSTLIAIVSDAYSSRYWCQREILLAKQCGRPIIVVNCLADYEDRIFPAASNVPSVHLESAVPISNRDILRILSSSLLETIRFSYSKKCLDEYRNANWIDRDCEVVSRPPELRQVISFKNDGKMKICYPEPPIYAEEADWHDLMGMEVVTPLWNPVDQSCLSGKKIGLSISEVEADGFSGNHVHADNLIQLSQYLGRHLLARSAILLYGGDLRPDGFTEYILDEAQILDDRVRDANPHVENHLAWPLYVSDPEIMSWRARFSNVMKTVEYDVPEDIFETVDKSIFLPPITPENLYIWSRCLSVMRGKSVGSSTARVCVGGRLVGFKGKMPGVLEELILALDNGVPVFLLGAFGGVVGEVCKYVLGEELPLPLTEDWQVLHNAGYANLQCIARTNGHECDYSRIAETIKRFTVRDLAGQCGLDEAEYRRLMVSPFIDECVHIILKGLKAL
ncbi:TIR domain-containing protein [Zhongshania sp.]|jgi:hypothetical protein|uniref:TIR domain-containing protein n=1 Tax=Zhongshania sp. TaxID=1971902 RepID=UPI0039E6EF56